MTQRIKEYTVIEGYGSLPDFIEHVNKKIEEGWQPFNLGLTFNEFYSGNHFNQVMVKFENAD